MADERQKQKKTSIRLEAMLVEVLDRLAAFDERLGVDAEAPSSHAEATAERIEALAQRVLELTPRASAIDRRLEQLENRHALPDEVLPELIQRLRDLEQQGPRDDVASETLAATTARLDALAARLNELAPVAEHMERRLERLEAQVAIPTAVPTEFVALIDRLQLLDERLAGETAARINGLADRLGQLDPHREEVDRRLEELEQRSMTSIDVPIEIIESLQVLDERLQAIDDRVGIERVTNGEHEIAARVRALENWFAALGPQTNEIDRRLVEIERHADVLAELPNEVDIRFAALGESVQAIDDRLEVEIDAASMDETLARIEGRISDLAPRTEGIDQRLELVEARLEALPTPAIDAVDRVMALEQRLDAELGTVAGVADAVARTERAVAEFTPHTDGLDRRLAALEQRSATEPVIADQVVDSLQVLDERLQMVDERLDIEAGFARLAEETAARVETLATVVSDFAPRGEAVDQRIEQLEGHATAFPEIVEQLRDRIAAIDERLAPAAAAAEVVGQVEGRLGDALAALERAERRITTVEAEVAAHPEEVAAVRERFGVIEARLTASDALAETVSETGLHLERLEAQVEEWRQQRDAIAQHFSVIEQQVAAQPDIPDEVVESLQVLDERLLALDKRLDTEVALSGLAEQTAARVEALAAHLAEIFPRADGADHRLDALEQRLATMPVVPEEVRAELTAFDTRLDGARDAASGVADRTAQLEVLTASLVELKPRADGVDQQLETLEQRLAAMPAVPDEVRTQLMAFAARLDSALEAASRVADRTAQLEALAAHVAEIFPRADGADHRLDALEQRLATMPAVPEEVRAELSAFDTRLDGAREAANGLAEQTAARVEALAAHLAEIFPRADGADHRLDALEQRLATMPVVPEEVRAELTAFDTRLDGARDAASGVADRTAQLEVLTASLVELKPRADGVDQQLETLEQRLGVASDSFSLVREQLETMEARRQEDVAAVAPIAETIANIERRLVEMDPRREAVERRVDAVEERVADQATASDEVATRLRSIEDRLAALFDRMDASRESDELARASQARLEQLVKGLGPRTEEIDLRLASLVNQVAAPDAAEYQAAKRQELLDNRLAALDEHLAAKAALARTEPSEKEGSGATVPSGADEAAEVDRSPDALEQEQSDGEPASDGPELPEPSAALVLDLGTGELVESAGAAPVGERADAVGEQVSADDAIHDDEDTPEQEDEPDQGDKPEEPEEPTLSGPDLWKALATGIAPTVVKKASVAEPTSEGSAGDSPRPLTSPLIVSPDAAPPASTEEPKSSSRRFRRRRP